MLPKPTRQYSFHPTQIQFWPLPPLSPTLGTPSPDLTALGFDEKHDLSRQGSRHIFIEPTPVRGEKDKQWTDTQKTTSTTKDHPTHYGWATNNQTNNFESKNWSWAHASSLSTIHWQPNVPATKKPLHPLMLKPMKHIKPRGRATKEGDSFST